MADQPKSLYAKADGVTFHYYDLGEGDPTIFLHGGGPGCTAWSDFGPVAPLFASDRRAILVDLLQYGRSDKCTIAGPMWDFHAAKMVALLDELGIERADFVCNSWGGTIALNLAAKYPERVRSLVITGSMPVFYGPLAPLPEDGRRGRNARDLYYGGTGPTLEKLRTLITSLEWFDGSKLPAETLQMRYEQSLDPEEMALAASADSPRGDWQDLTAELGQIQAPTLFAWGMHDAFLTPDYPLMLARMIPHGHLYIMDKASHHLQEERPYDYYSVVSGFLDQQHN
ncbi:alpha/beta fold hydrolase [Rhodococcus erythropolis]|jgi:pimeloyl-ACP methyl ester carboxylesterase|uniref:Alpha/beta fold hydrolase n=1 Tax=Rhodococcus erythropolis TaxID=1833 RepID=A0A8I0ZWF8_RHOER|nr:MULTISPECIES: alpha/beta hydrolase [Rhodococcus]AKD95656.1 hydrolase [Rhodococcus erythropolis]MBH5144488.1 alpha/beta fold hydrolase [Rhodococcus erythropolis]MBT1257676.1 alpha/beta fold hydrolase [Rhodococcus erythropolis]MBT2268550.1 alpha/beta fold hydrolase [Rhodococcus erythropolis]MBY6387637.1 alpha/beta fold hydrolase [Rhodococcus erythropolis]